MIREKKGKKEIRTNRNYWKAKKSRKAKFANPTDEMDVLIQQLKQSLESSDLSMQADSLSMIVATMHREVRMKL
jgi:hypothetical protein